MKKEIYFDELTVADREFLRQAKIRVPLANPTLPSRAPRAHSEKDGAPKFYRPLAIKPVMPAAAPSGEVIAMLALAAVALGCVAVWLIAGAW